MLAIHTTQVITLTSDWLSDLMLRTQGSPLAHLVCSINTRSVRGICRADCEHSRQILLKTHPRVTLPKTNSLLVYLTYPAAVKKLDRRKKREDPDLVPGEFQSVNLEAIEEMRLEARAEARAKIERAKNLGIKLENEDDPRRYNFHR